MKEILESLEIAEEVKTELVESFDKAVIAEATKLAESKEEAYEEYMLAQMTEMKSGLEDTLDSYLDKVVEQFVEDNTFAIDEAIKSEKYDAVLEGFNSLMIATGVEIAQIAESKEIKDEEIVGEETKIDESNAIMVDKLMQEVLALKERNAELLKTGLIKESMEDMRVIQKDKFLKLASVVEFDSSKPELFIEKLDTIVESVKGESKEEKVEEKVIVESATYKTASSHLF